MRVLHVISAPAAGGAEVFVKDLAKELVANGHSAHVAFLDRAEDIGRSIEFEQEFLDDLDGAGIQYFFLGRDVRKRPWVGMRRLHVYVRKQKIDVYHAHLIYGVIFGALLSIPRIYTHHNVKMRVSRLVFLLFVRPWIDQLVGICDVCAKVLSAHSGRDVTTIYNGIDTQRLSQAALVQLPTSGIVHCMSVGRICEQKNYGLLVKAIALLPDSIQSRLFVQIAGEGATGSVTELRARIAEVGLSTRISLLGNRGDIPALFARSQLFLMTSAWEGLPIALLEAARSGLPCLVTDVGGCREVIEKCQNGIVVPPDDAQAMADAIAGIVNDPTLLSEYSANALRFSPVFSITHAGASHISLYRSLL